MRTMTGLLVLLPYITMAQDRGIRFIDELSWQEILTKAKADNKFIFVHCYTTWCNSSEEMKNKIFTQAEVGKFFNKHFISVKIQINKTQNDNELVQKWYTDAAALSLKYEVAFYPTYLYFSPDGQLVHRQVSFMPASQFIQASKNALSTQTQYYSKIKNVERVPKALKGMATEALEVYDLTNARILAEEYISTQPDNYSKEMITFMDEFLFSSKDTIFSLFMKIPDKINIVKGRGYAEEKVDNIILEEEIFSKMNETNDVDLVQAIIKIRTKYPTIAERVLAKGKLKYYEYRNMKDNFKKEVSPFMRKYGDIITLREKMSYANYILYINPHQNLLKEAVKWGREAIEEDSSSNNLLILAKLLYKTGEQEEGIRLQEKGIELADPEYVLLMIKEKSILEKMKNGEKIMR